MRSVIARIREQLPGVQAIYLFGSSAREQIRRDSDIDLAVFSARPLTASERLELQLSCAREVDAEVDLVDLKTAPLTLQAAIVGEGKRLFVAAPREMDFVENAILSRYCAFNEERRPFFEAVISRGSIHA
jgi:predicted nucleotidyltransferase